MNMALILEDALPTLLSHGKHTLSGKRFRNVASFLLGTTRDVRHRHGIVGLHALSTRPHVIDEIEIWRACWTFRLFDTLSFEVVVGHVSTLKMMPLHCSTTPVVLGTSAVNARSMI